MRLPRGTGGGAPTWGRPWVFLIVLAVVAGVTILWPQYSPFGPPYAREEAGYSGLVIETGLERSWDSDGPDYEYIIVEEAPGRQVKHYLPPSASGILEGYHVVKEPGYGGRVYCPEFEDMMKQYRQYEARKNR